MDEPTTLFAEKTLENDRILSLLSAVLMRQLNQFPYEDHASTLPKCHLCVPAALILVGTPTNDFLSLVRAGAEISCPDSLHIFSVENPAQMKSVEALLDRRTPTFLVVLPSNSDWWNENTTISLDRVAGFIVLLPTIHSQGRLVDSDECRQLHVLLETEQQLLRSFQNRSISVVLPSLPTNKWMVRLIFLYMHAVLRVSAPSKL